ncbi:MAG: hypothetical protein OEX11_08330 [Nitrosomonas sp.]|nr:hypothetical protein [Nitrosomonas sp.]
MHFKLFFFVIVINFMLVSCAAIGPTEYSPETESSERPPVPLPRSTRPAYNLSGFPQATREGYIDGCEMAKQTEFGARDEERYEVEHQYRMGWDDGFELCLTR